MKELRLPLSWVIDQAGTVKIGRGLSDRARKVVAGISTDSRTVAPGEIFVALSGPNFDGHDHVNEALRKGALAALVQKRVLAGPAEELAIRVDDTLFSLGQLAQALRRRLDLRVIGLTGSNGKTTTKEMLSSILALKDPSLLATRGNFNNLVGLPLTLFRAGPKTRRAILEMGMNHFGEIARLTEIAEPRVGVIISVGAAHLEFFGSLSRVARSKGEIYSGLAADAVAVVDADEPLLTREARRFKGNKLFFGQGSGAQVRLGRVRARGLEGQDITLYGPGAENGLSLRLKLLGAHNAHNALAAAAAALAIGADWEQIGRGLEAVESFPGRLAVVKTGSGRLVLDDSYNANPTSMAAGLRLLSQVKTRGPKGAILGDMGELGRGGPGHHRAIGCLAAELKLDFLALVGPLSTTAARAARKTGLAPKAVAEFATPEEAARWVAETQSVKAAVLVKGSRDMHLEKAVEGLKNS